jgi:hypothetical protein
MDPVEVLGGIDDIFGPMYERIFGRPVPGSAS